MNATPRPAEKHPLTSMLEVMRNPSNLRLRTRPRAGRTLRDLLFLLGAATVPAGILTNLISEWLKRLLGW